MNNYKLGIYFKDNDFYKPICTFLTMIGERFSTYGRTEVLDIEKFFSNDSRDRIRSSTVEYLTSLYTLFDKSVDKVYGSNSNYINQKLKAIYLNEEVTEFLESEECNMGAYYCCNSEFFILDVYVIDWDKKNLYKSINFNIMVI